MTQSIDITPTILERAGSDIPHSMDGQSLLPFLSDVTAETRALSFSEYDFGHPIHPTEWQQQLGTPLDQANCAVLRNERYRLVHFAADLPPLVFDMAGEGERRNVADDQALCLELTRQLLNHRMANGDGTATPHASP